MVSLNEVKVCSTCSESFSLRAWWWLWVWGVDVAVGPLLPAMDEDVMGIWCRTWLICWICCIWCSLMLRFCFSIWMKMRLVHKSFIKHEYLYLPKIFTFVSSSTLSDSMMEIFLVCSLRLACRLSFSLLSLANSSLESKVKNRMIARGRPNINFSYKYFFSFAFDFREAILNFRFGAM